MFWVSLRQMLQERADSKKTTELADVNVPSCHTTENAVTEEQIPKKSENAIDLLKNAAGTIKAFLVRFWIFIVALTLLLCAIFGNEVTAFRIAYMTMFLIFIVTFQVSSYVT